MARRSAPPTMSTDAPIRRTTSPRSAASPMRTDPQAAANTVADSRSGATPDRGATLNAVRMQDVGAERQPAADGGPTDLVAAAGEETAAGDDRHPQDQDDRRDDGQDRGVRDRVDEPRPDAVDGAVRRDRDAGREGEQDGGVDRATPLTSRRGARGREHAPRALEPEESGQQGRHAERPGQSEAFPEQPHADRHREQRSRPARDRVDDREVAATVGRREEHEVAGLDDARQDAEGDPLRRDGRPARQAPCDDAGGHDPERRGEHPDRRGPQRVDGGLEADVPGDVQDGRDRDEADDEEAHPRTLPGGAPSSQVHRATGVNPSPEPRGCRPSTAPR